MQARAHARFVGTLTAFVLLVALFVPMWAVFVYGLGGDPTQGAAGGEVTVGIAAILRATLRRLLRGASSNFMRTTFGALGRASARAATRRMVKFAGRLFFGAVVQQSADESEATEDEAKAHDAEAHQERTSGPLFQLFALGLGFVALCLSFWGILHVVGAGVVTDLTGGGQIGEPALVLLAGAPLLVYACMHQVFGRIFGVRATYSTELDGLLLQAYFTGAGSFLPLTTDVDYHGSERGKRFVAMCSILGMFACHVLLRWIGVATGSEAVLFLGSMFLVYCFVYCFPIQPLEGHFIWASSKLQWVLVAAPILFAFLRWLPVEFGEIL